MPWRGIRFPGYGDPSAISGLPPGTLPAGARRERTRREPGKTDATPKPDIFNENTII